MADRLIALVSVEKCMSINSSCQRHGGKVFLKDLFTECLSIRPPPTHTFAQKHTHTCTNTHAAISISAITSPRVLLFGRVTVIEVAPLGAVHSGPLSAVSCCFFLKWVVFWLLCCFLLLSYRSVSAGPYLHVSLENRDPVRCRAS